MSKSGVEIRNYSTYSLHLPGYAVRTTTFGLWSTTLIRPKLIYAMFSTRACSLAA